MSLFKLTLKTPLRRKHPAEQSWLTTEAIVHAEDGAEMERIVQDRISEFHPNTRVSWEPVPEVTMSKGLP